MNLEELDRAFRSVLLQYMYDPEIIGVIKNNINTEKNIENSIEKTGANSVIQSNTNPEILMDKIDRILESQQQLENFVKSNLQNNADQKENDLKNVNAEQVKEILKLRNEKEELIKQNDSIRQENQKNISLVSQYSMFDKQLNIWNSMQLLNDENKDYIEKLCGSFRLMSILSLGRDEGKVEQLWLNLKDLAVNKKQDDKQINILGGYFEFCIEVLSECKEGEEYCMFDITPGEEFDVNVGIRTIYSSQIGNVSKTIVRGVKEGENIIYKPIVSVE